MTEIPVSGNGKLAVQFDLPLQQPEPIKFTGNYEFIDNQLDPGPRLPSLAKINGGIGFTESGLKVDNITARLLGGPVAINSANSAGTVDGSVRLLAVGKIDLDNLHSHSRDGITTCSPTVDAIFTGQRRLARGHPHEQKTGRYFGRIYVTRACVRFTRAFFEGCCGCGTASS